jgi:uncharacterized protein YndB with AHSA1/START domain
MHSIRLSIDIAAPAGRVWRALCDAAEVAQWDFSVAEALDAPADYPQPGQRVTWRLASGPYTTLVDSPQEVVTERRLRSLLEIGPIKMDETYELTPSDAACRVDLVIDWEAPALIATIAGRSLREGFEASLAGLKRHCEASLSS